MHVRLTRSESLRAQAEHGLDCLHSPTQTPLPHTPDKQLLQRLTTGPHAHATRRERSNPGQDVSAQTRVKTIVALETDTLVRTQRIVDSIWFRRRAR